MTRPTLKDLAGATALLLLLGACGGETAEDATLDETPIAEAPVADQAPSPAATVEGGLLDPNQATREQLLAVPGLTPEAADALIAGRPYPDMLAVDRALAAHLGEPERETVYGQLWYPIDLNTASAEEILLIPGVGERMQHEFEEYRPYRAIEQFRREMGKYVDDAEVARLERYVTIR